MLPRWLTEEEKLLMPSYLKSFDLKKASTPPNFEVRNMAEWEEAEYLVVTWAGYNSILREIVRYGREEAKVIVVCSDSNSVKTYLQNGNVSLNNVSYLQESFNSIWIRDYFGNTGYKNDVDGYNKEIEEFGNCFGSDEFKEGTSAFMEKRKPNY